MDDSMEVGDVPLSSARTEESVPVPQAKLAPSSFGEKPFPEFDEEDYQSHRNVYVAVHVPYAKPRHHNGRHKKRHRHRRTHSDQLADVPEQRTLTPELNTQQSLPVEPKTPQDPCDRVKFILGSEEVCDCNHPETNPTHTIFTELEEFKYDEHDQRMEWKETARWLKFEEDVEEEGHKWSKPHVATLSLHSLFELRSCLMKGTVLLDLQAENLAQIADYVLDDLVSNGELEPGSRDKVRDALLQKHKHLSTKDHHHESRLFGHIRSLGEIGRHNSAPRNMDGGGGGGGGDSHSSSLNLFPLSVPNLSMFGGRLSRRNSTNPTPQETGSGYGSRRSVLLEEEEGEGREEEGGGGEGNGVTTATAAAAAVVPPEDGNGSGNENGNRNGQSDSDPDLNIAPKPDSHLLKKIPPGAEASNVLVGEVDFLQQPVIAFVRLLNGQLLGDLTEVPIPTRFLFILLGPQGNQERYHEIGRSIATLMSDEVFHDVAYKARNRGDLLAGIDEFLDKVTVLPPGEWDPQIRLSPPDKVPSQVDRRLSLAPHKINEVKREKSSGPPPVKWTKMPCRGLIDDATRCYSLYWSDIRDAFSFQVVASVIFLYIASITVAITFGSFLSDTTNNTLGTTEMLLAVAIGNFIFALFSGQPLVILGSTGPTLIFEQSLFDFCSKYDIPFLNFRFWIGLWTALLMILLVVTNASAIMRLFTRFTEEIFATLVSFFFIFFSLESLWKVHLSHPYNRWVLYNTIQRDCLCYRFESGVISSDLSNATVVGSYWDDPDLPCSAANFSRWHGDGCPDQYQPDVFFFSVILFAGTILLAAFIRTIRKSRFFTSIVRRFVSDFAVFFAVVVWVCVDVLARVNTPKLIVPNVFEHGIFTMENRTSIFINPLGENIPLWAIPAAIIPAILATILLFIDQHITALIVNRKDHKLKKGPGYHLDLLIVGLLIFINSAFGLPWIVGATVLSVTHVQSLFLYSPSNAPGERPNFLGVREQRVTLFITSILLGLSILAYRALQLLPLPVLYGLLLYIGVASLYGVQFLKRIKLFFLSNKNKPDCDYFRNVPNWRIHLYTVIQIVFWCILCLFKFVPQLDVVFPLAVLLLVVGRWFLGFVFCKRDLELLDDPIPDKLYCKRFRYRKDNATTTTAKTLEEGKVESEDVVDGSINDEEDMANLAVINPGYKRSSSMNMTKEVDQCDLWRTMPLVRNLDAPPASPCRRVQQQQLGNKQRVSSPAVMMVQGTDGGVQANGSALHQPLGARRSLFQSTAV